MLACQVSARPTMPIHPARPATRRSCERGAASDQTSRYVSRRRSTSGSSSATLNRSATLRSVTSSEPNGWASCASPQSMTKCSSACETRTLPSCRSSCWIEGPIATASTSCAAASMARQQRVERALLILGQAGQLGAALDDRVIEQSNEQAGNRRWAAIECAGRQDGFGEGPHRPLQLGIARQHVMPVLDIGVLGQDVPQEPTAVGNEHPSGSGIDGQGIQHEIRCARRQQRREGRVVGHGIGRLLEEDEPRIGRDGEHGRPRALTLLGRSSSPDRQLGQACIGPGSGLRQPFGLTPRGNGVCAAHRRRVRGSR